MPKELFENMLLEYELDIIYSSENKKKIWKKFEIKLCGLLKIKPIINKTNVLFIIAIFNKLFPMKIISSRSKI